MKRRALFQQGLVRSLGGLLLARAALPAAAAAPAPAPAPRRGHWGAFDTTSLTGTPVDGSLGEWWAEFHDGGRFERGLVERFNHYRIHEWRDRVPDRIVVDGILHSQLTGFRTNGTCLLHPEVEYHQGITWHGSGRIRQLTVAVAPVGVTVGGRYLSLSTFAYHPERWPLPGTWVWER